MHRQPTKPQTVDENLRVDVIYRDDNLLVLNKPSGLAVLQDRSGAPCLWDQLPTLCDGKPYQVHRIDKGTSGLLLVARNAATQKQLTRMFQARKVRKFYLAWVLGQVERAGVINLALRAGRKSRYRVAGQRADIRRDDAGWHLPGEPDPTGHESITRMRPLLRTNRHSLLLLQPLTGRSHQLRVHLSWIGHPIVGDELYGKPADLHQRSQRLQLHCHRLVVPSVGSFSAALPAAWSELAEHALA